MHLIFIAIKGNCTKGNSRTMTNNIQVIENEVRLTEGTPVRQKSKPNLSKFTQPNVTIKNS